MKKKLKSLTPLIMKRAIGFFVQKHFDGWAKKQKAPLNELKWKVIEPVVNKFIEELDSVKDIQEYASLVLPPELQKLLGKEKAEVRAPRIAPRACAFGPACCGMARVRWSHCARAACLAVS